VTSLLACLMLGAVNRAGASVVTQDPMSSAATAVTLDGRSAVDLLVDTVGSASYFQASFLLSEGGEMVPVRSAPIDAPREPTLHELPSGVPDLDHLAGRAATGGAASHGPDAGPSAQAVVGDGEWLSAPSPVARLSAERRLLLPDSPDRRLFRPPRF
jgi:hypothetical protein